MRAVKRFARFLRPGATPFYAEIHAGVRGDDAHTLDAAPWLGGKRTGEVQPVDDLTLAVPVEPSKILCIGRNYAAHAKELGHDVPKEPLLFLKPPSALLPPGGTIVLPPESQRVEHEAEVGVVIGKRARHVSKAEALDHVFGYTCVGDITARDLQRSDGQWSRAKGFDTFCPVGPIVATGLDPSALHVLARVNGAVRQDGLTTSMIFDVPTLIEYTSRMMTLEPGDLLVTGTPEGVGPLVRGDLVEGSVQGVGALSFRIV
jgi:2-keto-4-pentenoate hydratase/2-oxohepta-3-ene-1,7-dioic acid hydratase in catechol pathway